MDLVLVVKRFLVDKFWAPVVDESTFYNPYNTAAYSMLFAVAAAYIGYPLLKKLDITLDRQFFLGITPYIFLGGVLRGLKDIGASNTILLETPFIYILMFGFVVSALVFSRKFGELQSIGYHRIFAGIGLLALIGLIPLYSLANPSILAIFIFISVLWIGAGYLFLRTFYPSFLSPGFTVPIAAHFFDATSTFVALKYAAASEKHVLGRAFIDLLGPEGMFVMKGLVIIPAVYYINENIEGEKKNYYLFLIALLGFAIATRNILQTVSI